MKVVTFSAALTNHIITPSTVFRNLPDHIQFYDKTITDAEARGPETFTAKQILEKSSNVGTDTIAKMVGPAAACRSGSTDTAWASRPRFTCPANRPASCAS